MSEPNSAWMNASIVPSRSPSVMPRSTASPSIWWNTGEWRASSVSRRNTRPGHHRVDRRALRLHHADLHRRGVRAQQHLLGLAEPHVERVLHRARGMARREVQRLEVVPVELDLGTFGDLVAHADEHVLELAPDPRDRMQVPAPVLVAAEREVEAVALGRDRGRLGEPELGEPLRVRVLERRLAPPTTALPTAARSGPVDALDRLADLVERRRLAEVVGARPRRARRAIARGLRSRPRRSRARRSRPRGRPSSVRRSLTRARVRRWRAASNSSTLPAIATFSDSPARHRDRHACRRAAERGRARASRARARTRSAPRRSNASGASPPLRDRAEPAHAGRPPARRASPLRHTLHDADRETRAGRGAHDFGIVRVDRARPEDDDLRAGRGRAAHQRARVARDRRAERRRPRDRPRRARRARRVERRDAKIGCGVTRVADRCASTRGRGITRRGRARPTRPNVAARHRRRRSTRASSTPWSSAAATTRGPSQTNAASASRARRSRSSARSRLTSALVAATSRLRRRRARRVRSRRAPRTPPARAPRGRRGSCGRRRPRRPSTRR